MPGYVAIREDRAGIVEGKQQRQAGELGRACVGDSLHPGQGCARKLPRMRGLGAIEGTPSGRTFVPTAS